MKLSKHATFVVASISLILVFITSGSPISLFNIYRYENDITNADLGAVSLGYFIAAALALLVFGRISSFVGRKPMTAIALLCVVTSCVLLINMQSIYFLFAARVLQGFACGVASSSIGAFVVDTSKGKASWLVAAVTSSSPMIGISTGAVSSGALATWSDSPRILIFVLLLLALLACMLFLFFTPETVKRNSGGFASLKPSLYFPQDRKRAFWTMSCCVVSTWSLGAFFQAFGPSVVAEQLHIENAFVTALVFSSIMILTPFGGYISAKLTSAKAVIFGMSIHMLSAFMILYSLQHKLSVLFLCASLLVGLSQGVATTGCLRILLHDIAIEHRAGLLSTIFVISYSGAVFPGLIASLLATEYSVFEICVGYVVLGVFISSLAIWLSLKLESSQQPMPSASIAE